MSKPLVLHHDDMDGIASAWVLSERFDRRVDLVPVQYGVGVPWGIVQDREVYLVDFSWRREEMRRLAGVAKRLVHIDHHGTAIRELEGLDHPGILREGNAGCTLTWEWVAGEKVRPPEILRYVEDRDLWRWKLGRSREVNAALFARVASVEEFGMAARLGVDALAAEGEVILGYQRRVIEDAVSRAVVVEIEGREFLGVCSSVLQSDIGEAIRGDAVCWTVGADGRWTYELRGRDVGAFCREVADKRSEVESGGGHPRAAGLVSVGAVHRVVVKETA